MSVTRRYNLLYNFSSLGLIQVVNFLLSLVVIPYVISVVGVDGFGVIAVAQVVIFYLSVIADYGFSRTAIRDVALYKDDRARISRIFFTVLASKFVLCFFTLLILLILLFTVPLFNQHFSVYLFAFSFVFGQAFLVNWFFQGLEKMQYMAFASLLSRLLFVAFVFIFMREKDDTWMYIFFMGMGNMVAGLISIYAVTRMYKLELVKPDRAAIKYELQEGWSYTVGNLSQTTIQYIGIFILRLFTNDVVVGYYSIGERIYFAMKLILDTFSQVAYPRACILLQEGTVQVTNFFRRTYIPFLGLVVIGSTLIFLLASEIIFFFTMHYYDYAAFLLRGLCVAVIIVCINIPGSLMLLAGNHKRSFLRIFATAALINIAANFILAPVWNAKGTLISVLITELLITVAVYREVYHLYEMKGIGKKTINE
jgi:PST family polysaccharide transporter